jgi:hypothetical protein
MTASASRRAARLDEAASGIMTTKPHPAMIDVVRADRLRISRRIVPLAR